MGWPPQLVGVLFQRLADAPRGEVVSTERVIVAVDESGPGGDKSVEVTARHRVDGGIDILSVRELPQDGQSVQCAHSWVRPAAAQPSARLPAISTADCDRPQSCMSIDEARLLGMFDE